MMQRLIEYAQGRGLTALFGDILAENKAMLALATQLGFMLQPTETQAVMRATLWLSAAR